MGVEENLCECLDIRTVGAQAKRRVEGAIARADIDGDEAAVEAKKMRRKREFPAPRIFLWAQKDLAAHVYR